MFTTLKAALLSAAFFWCLSGCTTPGSFRDPAYLRAWAAEHDFVALDLHTGVFSLTAFSRPPPLRSDTLAVYIEGDGAPWPTPYHPPRDPTPLRSTAWAMAMADPGPAVVYLGRPCQYLGVAALHKCDSGYWTERRFAPEVVSAYADALSQLQSLYGFKRLRLIGFSGGGVIATLLAAQRNDVELLATVAAPLSLPDWVALHGASPLTGSVDPAELGPNVRMPPSVHFVGANDNVVPLQITQRFVQRKGGQIVTVPLFDHECCWARDWRFLLGSVPAQEDPK